jgi:S-DNA-T family DNA segregation ATPase FtsK/SpoIIIE
MTEFRPVETDDSAIPVALRRFIHNRILETSGLIMLATALLLAVCLATWSADDPSWNNAIDAAPQNLLGYPGAVIADEFMQRFGLAIIVFLAIPIIWSVNLIGHNPLKRPLARTFAWLGTTLFLACTLSLFPVPEAWVLSVGLGGGIGDIIAETLRTVLSLGLKGLFATFITFIVAVVMLFWCLCRSVDIDGNDLILSARIFGEEGQDVAAYVLGIFGHLGLRMRGTLRNVRRGSASVWQLARARLPDEPAPAPAAPANASAPRRSIVGSAVTGLVRTITEPVVEPAPRPMHDRVEPVLSRTPPAVRNEPVMRAPVHQPEADLDDDEFELPIDPVEMQPLSSATPADPVRVERTAKPIKKSARAKAADQPAFRFNSSGGFELPSLSLLTEPQKSDRPADLTDEALEQNARMLEGVLEDFGIRGEIINVRPGPVVTLYELEPAPGIKSSRVIGLADDIARSMSAISARVAVVPGRNAIGIELPNSNRETVYLREMLGSQAYEKTKQNLALALGKNIGGEPIFADLARMPHLLIAGTTGSGKSVGINTMILSLLYKHKPEDCKLIMIDPKMLELSIYEGIPHLLAPVVTDPKKAVVALKWAVREMEDRYRKMSKVGVRNVDGFNGRIAEATKKGEGFTRTVQTGYDPDTGEPIFEQEEMDLAPMPYIVVIIDEMADLMMVAGKEIEGAVQRLAQMARAAGIHVVMATQRPSVDVITGTIKANFPTRISFQVTSKIDSRTILGEMGAEQLLGQGDMLFMAGGGRISRLHGPFVSDSEVEDVVNYLKTQGAPDYVEAVTEDDGELGGPSAEVDPEISGASGNELYDHAVAVVLRDKKVSTSYIQRRLQIGYNRAASLIERMETEGLISAANHAGKREILVGGDSEA